MNTLIEKMKKIVLELEKERGPILVCALILRSYPFEIWDMVISATWINSDYKASSELIGLKIQKALDSQELFQFSRFVVLDTDDPATIFFQDSFSITNGKIEELPGQILTDRFGFEIKKGYLLRCQKISKT